MPAYPLGGGIHVRMELLTSRNVFKDKIIRSMITEINARLSSANFQNIIRRRSKIILKEALLNTPVYQSMADENGVLRSELGVVNSGSAMNSLVNAWVKSTKVTLGRPRVIGHRIVGDIISITAIQADYEDVLSKAYASYQTDKGVTIPWLEWLLKRGDEILITKHKIFHPRVPTASSRTGTNTIMRKTRGSGWGVPIEFSGVEDDNFCTRAVNNAIDEIGGVIAEEVKRRL